MSETETARRIHRNAISQIERYDELGRLRLRLRPVDANNKNNNNKNNNNNNNTAKAVGASVCRRFFFRAGSSQRQKEHSQGLVLKYLRAL